jgi:hypothetical protein
VKIPTCHEFHIPNWKPLLLNRLLRKHWTKVSRLKKAEHEMIACYFMMSGIKHARSKRRVSLRITLKPHGKESDDDAVWKCLLDGLKLCGAIKDDDRAHVEIGSIEYERGTAKDWGTTIVLQDVEDAKP